MDRLAVALFIAYSDKGVSAVAEVLDQIPIANDVANDVASDPVLSAFELPLHRTFFPLGYPLTPETNSPDVILAAEESWGAMERMFDQAPARVCLGVAEGESEAPAPGTSCSAISSGVLRLDA